MVDERSTRRRFLTATGATLGTGIAGCFTPPTASPATDGTEATDAGDGADVEWDRQPASERQSGEGAYSQVYEATIDSVVLLRVYGTQGQGSGSGFVYDDGYLLTNHHVVANAAGVEVQYSAGEWHSASVVGTDPHSDLAVLEPDGRPDYATSLSLSTPAPDVGQEVLVIGNPLGLNSSLTRGIVSGVNRSLPSRTGFTIPDAIQTDAPVNPGNSGGPLVNMDAEVEGVVFAGGGDNVGFAISAALADRVAPALIERGTYEHSYVGVGLTEVTPSVAEANDLADARGVMVRRVTSDSPADGVLQGEDGLTTVNGIRVPVGGDVIVAIDGEQIPNQNVLSSYLALETSPGDTISITVIRDGTRQTVSLTLGERPDRTMLP